MKTIEANVLDKVDGPHYRQLISLMFYLPGYFHNFRTWILSKECVGNKFASKGHRFDCRAGLIFSRSFKKCSRTFSCECNDHIVGIFLILLY